MKIVKQSKPSTKHQAKKLLKKISHNELVEFMHGRLEVDENLCQYFLTYFGCVEQKVSKSFYQKQIHKILKSATDRDGWINWSSARAVANQLDMFVEIAEDSLANNNVENTFSL